MNQSSIFKSPVRLPGSVRLWLAAALLCAVCTICAQAGAAPAQQPAPYAGPTAGTLVWSGRVEKDTLVRIEGSRVSPGRLTGELPGVPVTIQPPDVFAVVEGPSAANGYKRLYLRSLKRIRSGVVIKWSVASRQQAVGQWRRFGD